MDSTVGQGFRHEIAQHPIVAFHGLWLWWVEFINLYWQLVVCGAVAILLALIIRRHARRGNFQRLLIARKDSVAAVVEQFSRRVRQHGRVAALKDLAHRIPQPRYSSLLLIVAAFIALTFVAQSVIKMLPDELVIRGLAWIPWILSDLQSLASQEMIFTLLQVQVGLAGAALPILIFVIEMSKDDERAATKSSEVLIRETWIFPTIMVALISVIKISTDLLLVHNPGIVIMDVLLVVTTVVLTIRAYSKALALMFYRATLKKKSVELLCEKMQESVIYSAETRYGNNWLAQRLQEQGMRLHHMPVGRDQQQSYYIVNARKLGNITDINVASLLKFQTELKPSDGGRGAGAVGEAESEAPTEGSEQDQIGRKVTVYVAKQFREQVRERDRALLLVKKTDVKDGTFSPSVADNWARGIFKIESDK